MPDAPASSDAENTPPAGNRCTGHNCKHPAEPGKKKCARCLEQNRLAAKKARQRKKQKMDGNIDGGNADTSTPAPAHAAEDSDTEKESGTESDSGAGSSGSNYETFDTEEALFRALRDRVKQIPKGLHFRARVVLPEDLEDELSAKDHVQRAAVDVWKASGFRFTVHKNEPLKTGHYTTYWCSQDARRKKGSKPSTRPDAKPRETPGMDRFPCKSRLKISYHRGGDESNPPSLLINLRHAIRHIVYRDTSMPAEAIELIRDADDSLTPTEVAVKVQDRFKDVSRGQVFNIWREKMEAWYRRADDQLTSARLLLSEFSELVDVFDPVGVPADVQILAWGMKKIGEPLQGIIEETAMDATYNTNSRNLELYALMGELDNAGFPLAYCLMSTATSVSQGKRKKTLSAFLSCAKTRYRINPLFTHVDKDMGEIGALKTIWPNAKVSICWWHVDDAVSKRLKSAKLSTTPYKPHRAREQFSFISVDFKPPGKADKAEYEGGDPEDLSDVEDEPPEPTQNPSKLTIRVPLPQPSPPRRIDANGIPIIRLPPGPHFDVSDTDDSTDEDASEEEAEVSGQKRKRKAKKPARTFCAPDFRAAVIQMMKTHSHAHELIPGFCHPSAPGIHYWAVKQMYDFCVANDLREAWAYLWGNWYRSGRWELWVRAANPKIPRLRTTMICESHWRKLKQEYLHEYHSPRLDLLVWVIVTKLCNPYYDKLVKLTTYLGRNRLSELASWRETFHHEWRKLEKVAISDRVHDTYRPDVKRWVCSCPAFLTSRFLICKHLIRLMKVVPTRFFREVKRQHTAPFWQHPDLVPVDEKPAEGQDGSPEPMEQDSPRDPEVPDDEDDNVAPYVETQADRDFAASAATFEAEFDAEINRIEEFVEGLKYQRQFRDRRMLELVQKRGSGFLRMARACLSKEATAQDNRRLPVRTWDVQTADAMYYRPRPRHADRDT
uniref:SWIM-type domain-containing protein n=1 Tax=Mycena chlorophos TaxID=658473 RepID=A0ABQ0LP55_MYCCL|nr:predicted protein [Mycena chlorophos]